MSTSVLLSHKIKSVNIFKCLETMGLETMNLPQSGNLYVLHLREKDMWGFLVLFVLFFTPEAEPSVTTAIPLEVSLSVLPVVHACHVS